MFISTCLLIQSNNSNLPIKNNKQLLAVSLILDIALVSISIFAIFIATGSGSYFGLSADFSYLLIGSTILLSIVLSTLMFSILNNKKSKEKLTKQLLESNNSLDKTVEPLKDKINELTSQINILEKRYDNCLTSKEQLQLLIDDLKYQREELEKRVKLALAEGMEKGYLKALDYSRVYIKQLENESLSYYSKHSVHLHTESTVISRILFFQKFTKMLKILGLSHNATNQEVEKAYRSKARATHPDKNPSPEATAEMQKLNDLRNDLAQILNE